jgi:electron transport complex protein RnfB
MDQQTGQMKHASIALQRDVMVMRVDALLPQTQCTQCGYAGCRPYAEAIIHEGVPINQCPPGGEAGIRALASLLGKNYLPLNPLHGEHKPMALAVIDEQVCIGCTLCIQACPVDAIVGAAKQMHTVLAEACTGCELCVAPCPVDCIDMQALGDGNQWFLPLSDAKAAASANRARRRHEIRLTRLNMEPRARTRKIAMLVGASMRDDAKRAAIMAAMARAKVQNNRSEMD